MEKHHILVHQARMSIFFAKRTGEYLESITSIECERRNIHLGKASLIMDNPKVTIVKEGDVQYDFLNKTLCEAGL